MKEIKKFSYKKAFYWLLTFLVLLACFISYLVYVASRPISVPKQKHIPDTHIVGKDIEAMITMKEDTFNEFLSQLMNKDGRLPFEIFLDKDMHMQGELEWLHFTFPYAITSELSPKPDGNILLTVRDIHLGKLSLPRKLTLELIKEKSINIPWLQIDPTKEQMLIRLDTLSKQFPFTIQLRSYQKEDRSIEFEMQLPKNSALPMITKK